MKRVLFWVWMISGLGLVVRGIGMMIGGLLVGGKPVTAADRAFDRKLAGMVYQESLDRGDPPYMAMFYHADTVNMTEDMRGWGRVGAFFGVLWFVAGVLACVLWLGLGHFVFHLF